MDGGEIEDDAEACAMEPIDKAHELLGVSITGIDGEETSGLISPRTIEWILGDRHDLDVGITGFLKIGDQIIRDFLVGRISIVNLAFP